MDFISCSSVSTKGSIKLFERSTELLTKLQYAHLVGQKGIPTYNATSLGASVLLHLMAACATSTHNAALSAVTWYFRVSISRTDFSPLPLRSSFSATFAGRIPVSVPQGGILGWCTVEIEVTIFNSYRQYVVHDIIGGRSTVRGYA